MELPTSASQQVLRFLLAGAEQLNLSLEAIAAIYVLIGAIEGFSYRNLQGIEECVGCGSCLRDRVKLVHEPCEVFFDDECLLALSDESCQVELAEGLEKDEEFVTAVIGLRSEV